MDRSRKRIARRRSATGPCRRLIPVCGAASAERAAPQVPGSYHERFFVHSPATPALSLARRNSGSVWRRS